MPLNAITVGAAVTPTVIATYFSHHVHRKPLHQKPTAHISYHEGLRLIRSFLIYASHHTVEEIQAFTSQCVPHPRWVKVDQVEIPPEIITKAADTLSNQLGANGVEKVGGSKWWQWRLEGSELRAEWIEMRGDYTERKRKGGKGRRIVLYLHGGAYFFGSVDEHRYQMQRHARKLRARVFAPRYRLAPQFPFPCGLHDCLAAYLYLLTLQEAEEIILAGDSAGGGMVVSMLVTLRDQGLPLPAGAVLISPWVDLTHSFPSVAGDSKLDYIPAHGFMQRPSPSWPPPNDVEVEQITRSHPALNREARKSVQSRPANQETEAVQAFVVRHKPEYEPKARKLSAQVSDRCVQLGNTAPNSGDHLSIEIDGKPVILEDQIQMYATNQLLSHPLVSPVLQPSLGGLPPLLILTGGGEILRDEQIYLAHKAANPEKYPIGDVYQAEYDPHDEILHRYKPTDVQLQVWDDLCHVAPTLSFTRPAKFMYRSIAQFGAWALARAQHRSIEITDDNDVSVISSGSDTETDLSSSSFAIAAKQAPTQNGATAAKAHIGKAGDPLPPFRNHMIRQRVDRHGVIYAMAPESEISALAMPASDVGVIKSGPVRKWLAAKKEWDARYASEKRRVQKRRIREMMEGGIEVFGEGERPPRSALAGRMKRGGNGEGGGAGMEGKKKQKKKKKKKKKKKSWGMMLWSLWGSKHDKSTIRREEEFVDQDNEERRTEMYAMKDVVPNGGVDVQPEVEKPRATSTASRRPKMRRKSTNKSSCSGTTTTKLDLSRSRSRRRTVTVSDQGQTEAHLDELRQDYQNATDSATTAGERAATTATTSSPREVLFPSPTYIPES